MTALPPRPLAACPAATPIAAQRAVGRLALAFAAPEGRTRLRQFYQQGCLKARLPRGPGVEAVALNISGGIAGGDELHTTLKLEAGASLTFTTQAAERVYRALGEPARVATHMCVAQGAMLRYLPQETILFNGFALERRLDIELAPGARCLGVESLVFGRLAMGEQLRAGYLRDVITLRQGGTLLWQDMTRLEGDINTQLDRPGVAACARAVASIFAVGFSDRLAPLRAVLAGAQAGASVLGEVLLARILAPDAAALRILVARSIEIIGQSPLPRVWQS
jgi:urease accessory protein